MAREKTKSRGGRRQNVQNEGERERKESRGRLHGKSIGFRGEQVVSRRHGSRMEGKGARGRESRVG